MQALQLSTDQLAKVAIIAGTSSIDLGTLHHIMSILISRHAVAISINNDPDNEFTKHRMEQLLAYNECIKQHLILDV